MPHSYLSMTASTPLRPILTRAKSMARLPTATNGLNFLGSTDAERNSQTIYLANDVQRQLLDRFPVLSIVSAERTTAATTFNLPAAMRATDLLMATWNDADTEIEILTQAEYMLMSDKKRAFGATADRPSYIVLLWAQSGGNGQGRWYPAPAEDNLTATIYYRARPSPFTTNDLTSDVITSVIPDEMIDTYALALAAEFTKRNLGHTHAETVQLVADAENTIARWQYMLAKSLSQRMQEAIGRSKFLSETSLTPPHDFWGLLRSTFIDSNKPKSDK